MELWWVFTIVLNAIIRMNIKAIDSNRLLLTEWIDWRRSRVGAMLCGCCVAYNVYSYTRLHTSIVYTQPTPAHTLYCRLCSFLFMCAQNNAQTSVCIVYSVLCFTQMFLKQNSSAGLHHSLDHMCIYFASVFLSFFFANSTIRYLFDAVCKCLCVFSLVFCLRTSFSLFVFVHCYCYCCLCYGFARAIVLFAPILNRICSRVYDLYSRGESSRFRSATLEQVILLTWTVHINCRFVISTVPFGADKENPANPRVVR